MLQQVGHEATGCQSSFPGVKGSANEVTHSHPSRTNRADISKHPPPPTPHVFTAGTRGSFHLVPLRIFTILFKGVKHALKNTCHRHRPKFILIF